MAVPSQAAFVAAVAKKLGKTQSELGDALGIGNGYNAIHAWLTRKKKTGPTCEEILEMLYLCDWLRPEAQAALAEAQAALAAGKLWDLVPGSRLQGRPPKRRATGR